MYAAMGAAFFWVMNMMVVIFRVAARKGLKVKAGEQRPNAAAQGTQPE
jgi:hypothetical protein